MIKTTELFQSVPGVKQDWSVDWLNQDIRSVKIDWDSHQSTDLPLFFGSPFVWRNSRLWDNQYTWAN